MQSDRHRASGGDTEPSRLHTETDSEPDQDDKYVKRTGSVKRSLQRVMPTMFQPSLPVTTRYQALKYLHPWTLHSSIIVQPALVALQYLVDADQALHVMSCTLFRLVQDQLWRCTIYSSCHSISQDIVQSPLVSCMCFVQAVIALSLYTYITKDGGLQGCQKRKGRVYCCSTSQAPETTTADMFST